MVPAEPFSLKNIPVLLISPVDSFCEFLSPNSVSAFPK